MARPLRLEHPGALWHVAARGGAGVEVFLDDEDRREFLAVLGRTATLYGWRVHAWALTGSRYDLVVETPEPTLSRGMRDLNGVTTQRFNRRHHRTGPLFGGRFRAVLVERETHLLALACWIVLEPVRAGLARSAADWPWSSFRATAGLAQAPDWLETGGTLGALSRRLAEAQRRWAELVAEAPGVREDPWGALRGQVFLGSEAFARESARKASRTSDSRRAPRARWVPVSRSPGEIAAAFAAVRKVPLEAMGASPRRRIADRALLAWALRCRSRAPLAEIAATLDVGIAQASVLVRRGESLAAGDPRLAALVEEL